MYYFLSKSFWSPYLSVNIAQLFSIGSRILDVLILRDTRK